MPTENSLTITGRLGAYVYQRVQPGLGNVPGDKTRSLQRRLHRPTNTSDTIAQQARRNIFREGVALWATMTDEEKALLRPAANRRNMTTFNAFMSDYLKNTNP